MSKLSRPDLAALGLCALIVVAITVLNLQHLAVPDVLAYLATAALSAGAGIAVTGPGSAPTGATKAAAVDGPAAPVSVPLPAPAPLLEQAAPVATHAP